MPAPATHRTSTVPSRSASGGGNAGAGRILIAGVGLVSPLGHAAWPTFRALLDGKTLAHRAAGLPDDLAPAELVRALGTVGFAHGCAADPTVALAERAAREALHDAGLDPHASPPLRTFLATSKGAVTALTQSADGLRSSDFRLPPSAFHLSPHAHFADQLRHRLPCLGVTSHHVAACASSLYALDAARRWLLEDQETGNRRQEAQDRRFALVVTAESALIPLFIHSYRRLGVLAPTNQGPAAYVARPLDRDRRGFQLADLAAAVVLERTDDAPPPSAPSPGLQPRILPSPVPSPPPHACGSASRRPVLIATAAAAETYDLIRPDPRMPALRRMAQRFFALAHPDLIHLHAPGTADHDAFELAAIAAALDQSSNPALSPPSLYAVKGALGHGLGAAGLISLVVAVCCARARTRPPMPWLEHPLDAPSSFAPLHRDAHDLPAPSTHALFAAGFGGHTAGALLATP